MVFSCIFAIKKKIKMNSIGIRATPNELYYSIVQGEENEIEIKIIDRINIPKAIELPEQLKFLRDTLSDIINEFQITNACVRVTESIAQTKDIKRTYIEGVIQELFASSTIERYYIGQVSSISAKLNIKRDDFKKYVDNKLTFLDIENWDKYKKEERESIMSAISALEI